MPSNEICIIGAGVAGLKAAQTLVDSSKFSSKDLVILEAQDYAGGRLLTSDVKESKLGLKYDLGAAWFHDLLSNQTLADLVAANDPDIFDVGKDGYFDNKDRKVYNQDGPVNMIELKLNRVVEEMEKFIEIYFHDSLDVKDVSLSEIIEEYKRKYDVFLTPIQKKLSGQILRYLELWYGITWDKISGKYAIMDHHGRDLYNKRGYKSLIDYLCKSIPPQQIHLNTQVKKINRNNQLNDYNIALETANGEVFFCNYLVVTVPQSVLQLDPKHPYGLEWNPPLPERITDALSSIHFGALGKVVFEFATPWWDLNEDRFLILANENDTVPSKQITESPPPFTFPAYVLNYASIHKSASASSLVILTQSPLTEYLEAHPEKAWSYYEPMLRRLCAPGQSVADPINTITSKWTQNPFIRGSYAALHVDDDPSDLIIQLLAQFPGTGLYNCPIRFAGEHTISDGAGCVHGAYQSGIDAANWIIDNKV